MTIAERRAWRLKELMLGSWGEVQLSLPGDGTAVVSGDSFGYVQFAGDLCRVRLESRAEWTGPEGIIYDHAVGLMMFVRQSLEEIESFRYSPTYERNHNWTPAEHQAVFLREQARWLMDQGCHESAAQMAACADTIERMDKERDELLQKGQDEGWMSVACSARLGN